MSVDAKCSEDPAHSPTSAVTGSSELSDMGDKNLAEASVNWSSYFQSPYP